MGKLAEQVLQYLNTTSSDQLSRDWEELKQYNEGPNILDVISNYGRLSLESPLTTILDSSISETSCVVFDNYSQIYNDSDLCLAA